jgi:Bacterial regulatory proteins, gntR family
VVRAIGAWILGARYKPGHVLPREDDLTESLGVSRTSLREAVKVLCAKPNFREVFWAKARVCAGLRGFVAKL